MSQNDDTSATLSSYSTTPTSVDEGRPAKRARSDTTETALSQAGPARSKASEVVPYFLVDPGEDVLIITDSGHAPYNFRLYTRAQYNKRCGLTDSKAYNNLRTLYRSAEKAGSYLTRRSLYDFVGSKEAAAILKRCGMAPGRFAPGITHSYSIDQYPTMIIRVDTGDGVEYHGSRKRDVDDRLFDQTVDQFGRENIWLQTRGGYYKTLDEYERCESWSARGGFRQAVGAPKALIRGADGVYGSLTRYCFDRGSLNGSLKGAWNGDSSNVRMPDDADVIIMAKDGESYISPELLRVQWPHDADALIEAAGLPRRDAAREGDLDHRPAQAHAAPPEEPDLRLPEVKASEGERPGESVAKAGAAARPAPQAEPAPPQASPVPREAAPARTEDEKYTLTAWTHLDVRQGTSEWRSASNIDGVKSIAGNTILSIPPGKDILRARRFWPKAVTTEYEAYRRRRLDKRERSRSPERG